MKKINLYIFVLILLFPVANVNAQENRKNAIIADRLAIQKIGDSIKMLVNLNLDNVELSSQEMITVTPIARSADGLKYHEFAPVVVTGRTRDKALKRLVDFGNFEFQKTPQLIQRRYNNRSQSIPLELTLPYEDWLHEADLVLMENTIGCSCEVENNKEYDLASILPPKFTPEYGLSYVIPPVEEVKRRSETHSALINFELNKYKLLNHYKNNSEVLDEVDHIVRELRSDPNLNITEFTITGYASPEGVPQHNMTLSENRAHAFVAYLKDRYNISPHMIKTNWKGEDWDGLKKIVEESSLPNKDEILQVISGNDIMVCKTKLKQLNGGNTYKMLLENYYPSLRRNEYTISYVARPFSIEEAKEMIKKRPHHLSENEIFLVAHTYPKDSKEFKETFDIASRIYPNNPYTQLNTIALNIERDNCDNISMQKLQEMEMPEAWNNLGVMCTKQGQFEKAEALFIKAADAGCKEAAKNKEQLSKFLASNMLSDMTIIQD